jgi:hypothetical protein
MATEALLAHVLVAKYADSCRSNRQAVLSDNHFGRSATAILAGGGG